MPVQKNSLKSFCNFSVLRKIIHNVPRIVFLKSVAPLYINKYIYIYSFIFIPSILLSLLGGLDDLIRRYAQAFTNQPPGNCSHPIALDLESGRRVFRIATPPAYCYHLSMAVRKI